PFRGKRIWFLGQIFSALSATTRRSLRLKAFERILTAEVAEKLQRPRRTPRAARIGRANALRTALSGVPKELGQRCQDHLRRLLLASRSFLRLRFRPQRL